MDVSIIINSYNLSSYISKAITTLLAQDYKGNYEIIVVDDASTDDTKSILDTFKDPKLKFIFLETNKGARHATEYAFAQSTGKYICRFDADDQWPPFFIRKAVAVLDANKDIDMVYGDCSFIDAHGFITSPQNNIARKKKDQPIVDNEFEEILKLYYINAPTIMFRRTSFAKAIPMPAHLSNFIDWFITLTVLQKGKAYYINEPIAYYRIHTTNMHRQQVSSKMGEEVTRFIMKHFVIDNHSMPNKLKQQIICVNLFGLAEKYFGVSMWQDAKRLYVELIKKNFRWIFKKNVVKHYVGSIFPGIYLKLKKLSFAYSIINL